MLSPIRISLKTCFDLMLRDDRSAVPQHEGFFILLILMRFFIFLLILRRVFIFLLTLMRLLYFPSF